MATTVTVRFNVRIKRQDIAKLKETKTTTEAVSDIRIDLSISENRTTADVHVEISGDEHQAAAFTGWVQAFALQPTY